MADNEGNINNTDNQNNDKHKHKLKWFNRKDDKNSKKEKDDDKKENKGDWKNALYATGLTVIVALLAIQVYLNITNTNTKLVEYDMGYSEFLDNVENGTVEKVRLTDSSDTFDVYLDHDYELKASNKDETTSSIKNNKSSDETDNIIKAGEGIKVLKPDSDDFKETLLKSVDNVEIEDVSMKIMRMRIIAYMQPIIMIVVLVLVMTYFTTLGRTGSKFTIYKGDEGITFEDVAGMDEVKAEVESAVHELRHYKELAKAGARPTKGILLEGPPGVGKTLLARAIAGEAKVPFISVSGSDFIEMFVGLGAQRVRSLYKVARQNAPCVIFIDEIDALAPSRSKAQRTTSENDQTLNALLQKMDGVGSSEGILIIGATNMVESLDSALLRPGRFDKRISVGPPRDKQSRDEIIRVHLRNKQLESENDFEQISKMMFGMTGAEIASALNEAVILSMRDNRKGVISAKDVDTATMKLRTSGVIVTTNSDQDRWIAAVHEAGHAVMNSLYGYNVVKVSIQAYTSGIGGITMCDGDQIDNKFKSKSMLLKQIDILLAGMTAEEVILGEHTIGCSNDLERATQLCKQMVGSFGMYDSFISMKGYYADEVIPTMDTKIFDSVNKILKDEFSKTKDALVENRDNIVGLARKLMIDEVVLDFKLEANKTENSILDKAQDTVEE